MAFKFVAFATLVAAANAGVLPIAPLSYAPAAHLAYASPITKVLAKPIEYDAHPQYSFAYDVHDAHTGDAKSQHEIRDGDVVKGSYSLIEADGSRRVVDYTADSINGFNAVVHKEPTTLAYKTVAPVVHASPLAYGGPIAHASTLAYGSPIVKYAAAPFANHYGYAHTAGYVH